MNPARNASDPASPPSADQEPRLPASAEEIRSTRPLPRDGREAAGMERTSEARLSRLAQALAHDMNNILTVIGGNVDWLLKNATPNSPDDERLLQNVLKAVRQGSEIMGSLEAYTRSTGDQPASMRLDGMMDHVLRLVRRLLPRTVDVRYDPDPDLSRVRPGSGWTLCLLVDWVLARSQTCERGEIRIIADLPEGAQSPLSLPALEGKRWFRFIMQYEGGAIDQARFLTMLETLALSTTATDRRGSPVQAVRPEHGVYAAARLESPPAVDLYLPCEVSADPSPDRAVVSGRGEHIAVLDDEVLITQFIQRLLETHGYQVHVFHTGESFLAWVRDADHPMNAAVIDGELPDISGWECVQVLHELRDNVPIILISGHAAVPPESKACAISCLEKPFSTAQLLEAVRLALTSSADGKKD